MKKIMIILLALLAALSLWGCGKESSGENDLTRLDADSMTASALYTVVVTDEDGQPIPGAMIQLCSDVCILGTTNEDGVAWFHVDPDDYKATIAVMPQGYTYAGDATEFTFPENSQELTIVLMAQ